MSSLATANISDTLNFKLVKARCPLLCLSPLVAAHTYQGSHFEQIDGSITELDSVVITPVLRSSEGAA